MDDTDYLLKKYYELCKRKNDAQKKYKAQLKTVFVNCFINDMESMGFNLKKSIFHRAVNNEIVQLVSYTAFNGQFTIQFEIIPFCCGSELKKSPMYGMRVGDLIGNEIFALWDIDENLEKNMNLALEFCKANLFPYLESIYDTRTYMQEENKRYKMMGCTDGIPILNSHVFFASLKLHNYDLAIKSRKSLLYQNENAFRSNGFAADEQLSRYLEIKKDFEYVLDLINNNNEEKINEYIEKKEIYSKNSYYNYFYNKKSV